MSEKIIQGIGVSDGIRIGKAFVLHREFAVSAKEAITEDQLEKELLRYQNAVRESSEEVNSLIAGSAEILEEDKLGVLKGQKSILEDPAFLPEIEKLIQKKLFSPEKAVRQVTEKFALLFESMQNTYMQERASDVRDAGNRLLKKLSGVKTNALAAVTEKVILIAEDLSPADTIQLDRNKIEGFITEKGGQTSHTAIFAKSMGIPAVVGASGIRNAAENEAVVILDSTKGLCIVSPEENTIREYEQKSMTEREELQELARYSRSEAITNDHRRFIIAANIGSPDDAEYALGQGAEEIGLLRTESFYLAKDTMPSEDEQFAAYRKIAEVMKGRNVIIRTLDIGGDKAVGYLNIPKEENPFLGYRAIRLCLDRKELFLTQLRALLRASAFGKLKIMFPMISGLAELREAKAAVEEAKAQLRGSQIPFDENIPVGIMIEIPAAALMADVLATECDFFSIGTNDLVQYTLAVDRGNSKIAALYDYCHPAVLALISRTVQAAHAHGIPVGMCGGMAGDPLVIPLLVGLGLDELSMAAGAIQKAKYTIHGLNSEHCAGLAAKAQLCGTPQEVRELL